MDKPWVLSNYLDQQTRIAEVCRMKTYLSIGDLADLYRKFRFKGRHVLGRFFWSNARKVAANWDRTELPPSNWWNVPAVRKRWEEKITDGRSPSYPDLVHDLFLLGKTDLSMASPGCGTGSHERFFVPFPEITRIDAFDISEASIAKARENNPGKVNYQVKDFYSWMQEDTSYDIIFFYSSLHHFKNLDHVIPAIKRKLNPEGILIIHEYVGPDRMMWTRAQRRYGRDTLKKLPGERRTFVMGNGIKKRIYRPGIWRTLLSDPSESVESSKILPLLHQYYKPVYERGFGGSILHPLLKDISHHFLDDIQETRHWLELLFQEEDLFLKKYPHDFWFGVYQ